MSEKKKIRVAIVGVGNCASSLVQGVAWYNKTNQTVGLMYEDIGGYTTKDIEFVLGFDVDGRKVGKTISEAIFQKPNCAMQVVNRDCSELLDIAKGKVHRGPTLDGIAPHMRDLPEEITFKESEEVAVNKQEYKNLLLTKEVDVLLNYVPVGSREAAKFYIENAIDVGVHVVNCMPTYIATEEARALEAKAIERGVTIVGSDMRSAWGASRLSEVLQGAMLDAGLVVTQHIQMNMAAGTTQGDHNIINGRSANTDFLNMALKDRLHDKHVSKENVLNGQNSVRGKTTAGMTMFAGPSLTVFQKPGGEYIGSDNKICNIDIVAYGFTGARYELTSRLSVQDSPNSGGIVLDALRFCKVASELGVVGYLRGPSAYSQKTPPVQLKSSDSKFECDALARRVLTPMVEKQLKVNNPSIDDLEYTFQSSKTDYE